MLQHHIHRQALAAMIALALAFMSHSAVAQIPDLPGWQLFWHDEFDGNTLNTTNWTALNRQDSYNNEKEYYIPSQVTVAGGNLQIIRFLTKSSALPAQALAHSQFAQYT